MTNHRSQRRFFPTRSASRSVTSPFLNTTVTSLLSYAAYVGAGLGSPVGGVVGTGVAVGPGELVGARLASTEGAGVEEGISVVVVVDVVGTGLGAFVMLGAGLGSCVMLGAGLAVGTGVGSSDPEVWAGGAVDTEGSGVGARVFGDGVVVLR